MEYTRTFNHRNTIYVAALQAPGTSAWSARLQFPNKLAERLAEEDGRCAPMIEVSKGPQGRYKYLHEAKLPARLEPLLDELIEEVTAREHLNAKTHGVLPVSRERRDYYRDHDATIEVPDIARADAILTRMRAFAPPTSEMVCYAAELASETVDRDDHESQLCDAKDEVAELERKVSDLEDSLDDARHNTKNAAGRIVMVQELTADLDKLVERLKTRNLVGAYGQDDFEKVIDLMQPITDAGWEIANAAA
jgi:hypothetical protein